MLARCLLTGIKDSELQAAANRQALCSAAIFSYMLNMVSSYYLLITVWLHAFSMHSMRIYKGRERR